MPEIPETIGPRAGASPLTVTLSELGTVDLEGSFAHFNGTGASGSFLAALTIKSQNGAILSRVWPSTTFAAGDTGDVTYVPLGLAETSSGTLTYDQGVVLLGATKNLLGWWRLGNAASPFLDSNPYLTHIPQIKVEAGVDYTPQVTGCLAGTQDDGALLFNGSGDASGGTPGDYLNSQTGIADSRYDGTGTGDFSVGFYCKPTTLAGAFEGLIVGRSPVGALSPVGWCFLFDTPGGTLFFQRQTDGIGSFQNTQTTLAFGACAAIFGTYSTTAGMKLYVNGALVDSDAGTFPTGPNNAMVAIGAGPVPPGPNGYFHGQVDEVTVWGSTLSAADVANLYTYGATA